jgi:transposase InsO family protein
LMCPACAITVKSNSARIPYTADDFIGLLARHGVRASVGSVGDSFDNALAETVNGAYKTELINKFGPWDGYESLNLRTAEWVHCVPQFDSMAVFWGC